MEKIIQRDLYPTLKQHLHSDEALVVTGMRRTGKTTLLRMIYDELETPNKLFLDMENPAQQQYFLNENYDAILGTLRDFNIDPAKRLYLFLDEIQSVPSLPSVAKYLLDHYGVKFFLSGSASFYIHNIFSESMAGRKFIFELFPFSFREFARFKDMSLPQTPIAKASFLHIQPLFDEYLRYGGFPGVVSATSHDDKLRKLNDVFSSYWTLEVERLSDFRKKDRVRDLIALLMQRTGSKIDIGKLSKTLGIARNTLESYIAFLEDTYLISRISPYSTNRDNEIRGAKKFYMIDSGLVNNFARVSEGALFENACFTLLRQRGSVQYYQTKQGQEIDFITDRTHAYEAKLSAQTSDINTLARRAKKIGIGEYSVVSKSFAPHPHTTYGFLL